jgi:hypothetical protein
MEINLGLPNWQGEIMNKLKLLTVVVIGVVLTVMYSPGAQAQAKDDWHFYVAPALWAGGIDAKIQAGSITMEGDASFGDIVENLKGGLMGEMGAKKNKFSIDAALVYMGLQKDIPAIIGALGDRTTNVDMLISQAMFGYDLLEVPVGKEMKLTLTPAIGPRYFYTRFIIDQLNGGELRDKTTQWVDFTTGLSAKLDVNKKFSLLAKGSAGGFGWGDSSELAWSVGGFVDYHIRDWSTLRVGYSYLDVEKKCSANFGDVQLNLQISGPVVEWVISFYDKVKTLVLNGRNGENGEIYSLFSLS